MNIGEALTEKMFACEDPFLHETRWWGQLEAAFSHPLAPLAQL